MSSRTSTTTFKRKLITAAVVSCFASGNGMAANSSDATVVHGGATFSTNGSTLTITNTPNAIINWAKFGIDAGETVKFVQQSSASAVLNRVTGSDPSHILGALQSNGKVYLINPNGIMFGVNARIDVNGLVASTLNLSDADFLAGKLNFNADRANPGSVINAGTITTPSGGFVYLLAPNVENSGVITTPSGEAILAAGNSIEIVDSTDPSQRVLVSATSKDVNLSNLMTQSNGNIFTVLNSGKVSANTVVQDQTGKIYFKSVNKTLVTGTAEAHGDVGKGGQVQVLGDVVGVYEHAVVDASGRDGGGTVLVGGDYQGKNANVQNATVTYFGPDAQIHADAIENGNGGKVILWADDTTRAYGHITAKGGSVGGNGGFIETSGHYYLDVTQAADASAAHGLAGMWLLDPTDFSIVHGTTDSSIYGGPAYIPLGAPATSVISDTTLNGAINFGTSVSISTSSAGPNNGDIIFDGTVSGAVVIDKSVGATFGTTLTLNADHDIKFKGSTTIQNSSTSQPFSVVMNTGAGRKIKSESVDSANVTINSAGGATVVQINGGKAWENSGTVSFLGNSQLHLHDGSNAATFDNLSGGTLNLGSTNAFAIYSSASDDGVIQNDGTVNVSSSTALEALYNQSSTGKLSVANTKSLNLQNPQAISGEINLNASGVVNITERHGVDANFSNTNFTGTGGQLNLVNGLGSPVANFTNVSAPKVTLGLGAGTTANITGGTSTFAGLNATGGTFKITNGIFDVDGNLTLSTSGVYSGVVGITTTGDLNITAVQNFSSTTTALLTAGNDLNIGATVSGAPTMILTAGRNANFNNAFVNANLMDLITTGSVNLNNATVSASTMALVAGGDVNINSGSVLQGSSLLSVDATNMTLTAGSGSATVESFGVMDINLSGDLKLQGGNSSSASADIFGSPDIGSPLLAGITVGGSIFMNTGAGGGAATIESGLHASIYIAFPNLGSGGYFVDGVEGVVYNGTSGFVAGGLPAILDTNLHITYGGGSLVSSIINLINGGTLGSSDLGPVLGDAIDASTPTEGDLLGTGDDEEKKEDKPQQCSA